MFSEPGHILQSMGSVKSLSPHEMFLRGRMIPKSDNMDDMITNNDLGLENVTYNKSRCNNMIAMIDDDVEIAMVNELFPDEKAANVYENAGNLRENMNTFSQESLQPVKFMTNVVRGRKGQIKYKILNEAEFDIIREQENFGAKIKTEDDPRNHLHYVRYFKREGKTLKVWECGICGKEFRHQYTLMRHLPTHTDERNFKCEVCGKGFRQMSTLSQHRAIHSDARPYVCELCKKTFNRVSTLISHRKTHSEHKPHKCHVCGKGFHQKGNLRNHVFTHTNERPYKCEVCGKGFNQMSNLMCHKQKAHGHGDKVHYSCKFCEVAFARKNDLKIHEENKHGLKYIEGGKFQVLETLNFNELVGVQGEKFTNISEFQVPQSFTNNQMMKPYITQQADYENHGAKFLCYHQQQQQSILIDPLNTPRMNEVRNSGRIPFALLKCMDGSQSLYKVLPAPNNKQVLIPATVDDLKAENGVDVSCRDKPVQRVPIAASLTERRLPCGQWIVELEPQMPAVKVDREAFEGLSLGADVNSRDSFSISQMVNAFCHGPADIGDVGVEELRAAEQHIMFEGDK